MRKLNRGYLFTAAVAALVMQSAGCGGNEPAVNDKDNDKVCVNTAKNCSDGIDNDCDGLIDCKDSDCAEDPVCKKGDTDTDLDGDLCKGKTCTDPNSTCNKVTGSCDCNLNFIDEEGDDKGCINEKIMPCDPSNAPADSEPINADVTASYTTADGWFVEDCDFNCINGTVKDEGYCVDDIGLCDDVTCDADNTKCDLATGDCVCLLEYVDEGDGCIHTKDVECDASKVPTGGIAIKTTVTATYSSIDKAWVVPACDFDCGSDYVKKGNSCQPLDPNAPCKNDEFGKSYHRVDGECVRDVHFESGVARVMGSEFAAEVGQALEIKGSFDSGLCAAENREGQCPGVKAELCYGEESVSDFTGLTCVPATYAGDANNNDDIYSGKVTFDKAGDYFIFYRWNGNGVDWYYSDASGIAKNFGSANPVIATIKEHVAQNGLEYSQDFNTLSYNGGKWVDNETLAGWWKTSYNATEAKNTSATEEVIWNLDHDPFNYYANDGSASDATTPQAGVLSLGAANDTDRALGSLSSNQYQQTFYLVLKNTAEKALSSINVAYTGEQWRTGANKSENGKLQFSYAVLDEAPTSMDDFKDASDPFKGTTEVSALHFAAPQASNGTGAKLDGNAEANRVKISGSFNANVPAGKFLLLKWFDPRENGVNSSLAIDDLTVVGK